MSTLDFQQCTKTVMDNIADPDIIFDKDGVCNYWHEYHAAAKVKLIHGELGKQKWDDTVTKLKLEGKKKKYDCIIGVSGGVDSTYVAHIVKEAKLRPLVVHFDNGWNSETAVHNINRIIDYLDADLYTLVVDWDEFRDLQRAYLMAGVIDIEALTDHAIFGTLYRLASKNNIKYVIGGFNLETEFIMPKSWNYSKIDHINILDIHHKFGKIPLKTFPIFDTLKKKYYLKFKKLEFINPLDWASYNKYKVKGIISEEIGWQDYGGKHHESVFTKFYQNYILTTKFNVDKRKAHLSNLICSNQISREVAIVELEKSLYDPKQLLDEKEYVIKKMGFTEQEFDRLMKEKPYNHLDYKTEGPIEEMYTFLKPFKMVYKLFK